MNRGRGRHGRGGHSSQMAWTPRHTGLSGDHPQRDSTEIPVEGDNLSAGNTYGSRDAKKKLAQTYVGDSTSEHSGNSARDEPLASNDMKYSSGTNSPDYEDSLTITYGFDICLAKDTKTIVLKPSLLVKNREKRNEVKRSMEGQNCTVLRSGMVLLKGYLSLGDQVKIVKKCRDLGLGAGGFYQPGYHGGAKLCLKMMCLGKNWDPQTNEYGDHRPIDGSKPPVIPAEFHQLVQKAIRDSHSLIEQDSKTKNPEKTLPWMSPDICIVNFYSENGRLGLHQDRDESKESLDKGLPVVSFSIGDSADFLYGDQREIEKANKVVLESGDILIFGGRSRHVFHGVTAIHPNTSPKHLLEETSLRPGRLNLTFRQY